MPTYTNPNGSINGSADNDTVIFDRDVTTWITYEGNDGYDRLVFDQSVGPGTWFRAGDIFQHGDFYGHVQSQPYGYKLTFYELEGVAFTGSDHDDMFDLELSDYTSGLEVDFDGGGGFDTAEIDLSDMTGSTSFIVGENGITSSFGSFANIEQFTIKGSAGNDTIQTGDGDDRFEGGTGNDTLSGGGGNDQFHTYGAGDTIDGGDGYDHWTGAFTDTDNNVTALIGDTVTISNGTSATNIESVSVGTGSGNDTITVTRTGSVYVWGGEGYDRLVTNVGGTAPMEFQVGSGPGNQLQGFAGEAGFSEVERVNLTGGSGDDSFRIYGIYAPAAVTFAGGAGNDRLDASFYNLTGANRFVVAADGTIETDRGTFTGFENFTLRGGAAGDLFSTGSGMDYLNGEDGNDRLSAGAGMDSLVGGNGNDKLFGGDGNDYLFDDDGTDSLDGGDGDDDLFAGAGADMLTGGRGDDKLNGGMGADESKGGTGNDTYLVDDAGDRVIEQDGQGGDTVIATVDYSLAGQYVEVLILDDWSHAVRGTGNGLSNRIDGNGMDNILSGGGGNDRLDGKWGADTMAGGLGNDIFIVDDAGDKVIEKANEGTDTVEASISYSLAGQHIEILKLTGWFEADGTGNNQANSLYGNSARNVLDGMGGADLMAGAGGDDRFMVDNVGDKAIEAVGEGYDEVVASVSYSLAGQHVEALTLTGSVAINGTGNGLDNLITGNAGANTLRGGGGADVLGGGLGADKMEGGAGADIFYFDSLLGGGNFDDILDFAGEDTIHLNRAQFAAIGTGTLSDAAFRAGPQAVDASDRIVYDAASGNIWYDADGSGAGAAVLFAHVTAGTPLVAGDFVAVGG